MECHFGTSPQSVAESHLRGRLREAEQFHDPVQHENCEYLSLNGFIEQLPYAIEESKQLVSEGLIAYGSSQDPIIHLFRLVIFGEHLARMIICKYSTRL
jgi:hypothetical protein